MLIKVYNGGISHAYVGYEYIPNAAPFLPFKESIDIFKGIKVRNKYQMRSHPLYNLRAPIDHDSP
jgi:hypothetical protein